MLKHRKPQGALTYPDLIWRSFKFTTRLWFLVPKIQSAQTCCLLNNTSISLLGTFSHTLKMFMLKNKTYCHPADCQTGREPNIFNPHKSNGGTNPIVFLKTFVQLAFKEAQMKGSSAAEAASVGSGIPKSALKQVRMTNMHPGGAVIVGPSRCS